MRVPKQDDINQRGKSTGRILVKKVWWRTVFGKPSIPNGYCRHKHSVPLNIACLVIGP
jgi:hypothetical protein